MSTNLAEAWYAAFLETLQRHEASKPLKESVAKFILRECVGPLRAA